jgi:predicted SAM-dependent methyltransferase
MIGPHLRAAYYAITRVPMWANGRLYKHLRAPRPGKDSIKVQLGPGRAKYLNGWINVDANFISAKIDVWADLRDELPFRDNSVDVFYSHHVIEHLPDSLLSFHIGEMFRCLKPGGVIRIGGPNAESAAKKLIEGDTNWFGDFPEKRESIGGRYANFILCAGDHRTILTFSYIQEIASAVGFVDAHRCVPVTETAYPDRIGTEVLSREYEDTPETPHTLIFEARKP